MISSSLSLFSLLVLACVITQSFARPEPSSDRVKRGISEEERNMGAGTGTPEGIRQAPEQTRSYINWGNSNFHGLQGIMDSHFMKKKKEGEMVHKYGDKSRKEHKVMHKKIETSQKGTMADTFQITNDEMVGAVQDQAASRQRSEEMGSGGGGGGGSGRKAFDDRK